MSSSGNNNKKRETAHKQLMIGAGFVGLGIAQALKAISRNKYTSKSTGQ